MRRNEVGVQLAEPVAPTSWRYDPSREVVGRPVGIVSVGPGREQTLAHETTLEDVL